MDIYLLNRDFTPHSIIDTYQSFIWVDKYQEAGIFELMSGFECADVEIGMYIRIADSENIMVVENKTITTDVMSGTVVFLRGRSLYSILDRRSIVTTTNLKGSVQDVIEYNINQRIIKPPNANRTIPKFRFIKSSDARITSLKIDSQATGLSLYDLCTTLCVRHNMGVKVTLNPVDLYMEFRLYMGEDRTRAQTKNLPISFTPSLNNLLSSNYVENSTGYKNMAYIMGEGEGPKRKYSRVNNSLVGIDRRELVIDARDLSSENEDGTVMGSYAYNKLLEARGHEKLPNHRYIKDFEGEIEDTEQWKLNRDYFLGDLVEIENEYGQKAYTRISEIIISEDLQNGYLTIPTFRPDPEEEKED